MTRSFSPRAVPTFCTTFCLAAAAIAVFSISGGCDTAAQNLGNGGTRGEGPAGNPAPPGAPANFGDGAEADDASGGPAAAATVARAIEEADIVKVVGDKLYALNQFKGLLIVDVQDPDSPALLGELDLRGRGVEMYVGDTQAYVLLSADSYYYYAGGHGFAEGGVAVDGDDTATSIARDGPMPPAPDFEGSRLAIVDISDPTEPVVDGKINLVGFANESRRVGDIIYVIGSHYAPYFAYGAEDSSSEGQGFVASVNVADPDDIVAVERKSLAGNALMMHTSDSAIFAASQSYDYDSGDTMTDIEILDISDAAGAIALRGTFQVPGYIRNRFYMDAFGDTFRIASESTGFGFRKVRLFTYDISDLDDVADLGSTDIIEDESLQAVRFDGERAYAVTFLQIDPLFVIDLSDPANPVVAGELEVPGFSTHIEPRGNRLIAVGIDDTDGNRPAVAYYNVEDPANPTQIGRVILGPPGSYTSSDATYDEKAFKVVDELGLIAIPFQHVDYGDFGDERSVPPSEPVAQAEEDGEDGDKPDELPEYQGPTCTNGVQLVDFSDAELKQRGSFENSGNVTRVGIIGGRVFAISEFGLKTVDITDRDHPRVTGDVSFLEGQELAQYGGCGYIYYAGEVGIDPGFNIIEDFFFGPDDIGRMMGIESCSNATPLAGAALLMAMFFSRNTLRRRFGRRR